MASLTTNTAHDKLLFTPGPLTTSLSVKAAMLHDAGSWHHEFRELAQNICDELLRVAGVARQGGHECVLMQGSGTFGVESVMGSVIPPNGRVLALSNGAYGERILQMCGPLKIAATPLRCAEDAAPSPSEVEAALSKDPSITHVVMVHCETTTGVLNPIAEVGAIAKKHGKVFIVDAMSSFGGMPIDIEGIGIDFIISSANKCVEGVPGFSFIIARREALAATEGWARSLSLDLHGQWKYFKKTKQFRYTPPTHSVLAFAQALRELEAEGGVEGRAARYRRNHTLLSEGMARLGFRSILPKEIQSHIITSYLFPRHPKFVFDEFYQRLSGRGMIIYPGKLTQVDTFRLGNIGRLFDMDILALVASIESALKEMGVEAPF